MPQAIEEKEKLFAELDGLSEYDIRSGLAAGLYHPEDNRKLVELYLEQKRLARKKAAQAEQNDIAQVVDDEII